MNDVKLVDMMVYDGVFDVFNQYHMGITAENVAEQYGITREMQDQIGYESQMKAAKAISSGRFKDEIVPMLEKFCKDKKLEFRIPIAEVLDYCVLEYPFALWQWGTPTSVIPPLTSDAKTLFYHLVDISGPDYFAETSRISPSYCTSCPRIGLLRL